MVIYKLTNLINQKIYIGQTKDFNQRMRAHKSDAFNTNSRAYYLPLYCAIRKYGWGNFTKEIIDKCSDDMDSVEQVEWANKKEAEYIIKYNSLAKNNGYNISERRGQSPKGTFTFEEKVACSKLFNLDEIIDIQTMLVNGVPMRKILQKYSPKLTDSLLTNINTGLNFNNDKLQYPLHDYIHDGHSIIFTKEEQKEIQHEIQEGKLTYTEIAKKWGIKSIRTLSLINNGKIWKDENLEYPLSTRNNSRLHNFRTWVRPVQNELMNGTLKLTEIAKKYNKAYETIKKINSGSSYRNADYKYPLTSNRKK